MQVSEDCAEALSGRCLMIAQPLLLLSTSDKVAAISLGLFGFVYLRRIDPVHDKKRPTGSVRREAGRFAHVGH
jgi:hypothetical protein